MSTSRDRKILADATAPLHGSVDPMARVVARAVYMMGEDVDRNVSYAHATAWEGFVELESQLQRRAETLLEPYGNLSVSMLRLMGCLALSNRRTLGQTEIACAMGLSLSRVSRIIGILERRELVKRRPNPDDARATNVTLTPAGLKLMRSAQNATFDYVQAHFFSFLSDDEAEVLAAILTRLLSPLL